ncbi:D-lyxose/D-mannose family sugar isomerase [Lichenihabitans psoromatis]|uniref:D-lyxose/D-mannose family sugar isomerase n=1 Tax=Lichenihabitans psoromatis TaxID=2528642 RepID=UPI001036D814|nr:D-lyxose/D-mannose family sugar isomerase [Lichenihabitans psoromatis]
MKRSFINQQMRDANATFARHGYVPPPWATWSPAQWDADPARRHFCAEHQMGWIITDFGSGDFFRQGLILLVARNGVAGRAGQRVYAEKAIVMREGQEAPYHYHRAKTEDMLVRGGGSLGIDLVNVDAAGKPIEAPVEILVDGARSTIAARQTVVLTPGESLTLPPLQAHRFYGIPGTGTSLVGEISEVNDDLTDNYFLEPFGPMTIEDDEPALYLLWRDLAAG